AQEGAADRERIDADEPQAMAVVLDQPFMAERRQEPVGGRRRQPDPARQHVECNTATGFGDRAQNPDGPGQGLDLATGGSFSDRLCLGRAGPVGRYFLIAFHDAVFAESRRKIKEGKVAGAFHGWVLRPLIALWESIP